MVIKSIKSEYLRYKTHADSAISQIDDKVLYQIFGEEGNSIAIIMNHLSGNLISTDFNFLEFFIPMPPWFLSIRGQKIGET